MTFREAARFWVKLGFINFGGPAGQISLMHEEIVDRRSWVSEGRFLHALNSCMPCERRHRVFSVRGLARSFSAR